MSRSTTTITLALVALSAGVGAQAADEAHHLTIPVTTSLFDGVTIDGWSVEEKVSHYRIEDGAIVVHNPAGEAQGFVGRVGDADWNRYIVEVDLCVDEPSSAQRLSRGGFGANLQFLMPEGFVQFFDMGAMNVCWYDEKPDSKWTQLETASIEHPPRPGEWHRAGMIIIDGTVTPLWDGRAFPSVKMRGGCTGKVGLLVNFASDATMRLRHLTVTFLEPTPEQLRAARLPAPEPAKSAGGDF
jgi:hypothetical protein